MGDRDVPGNSYGGRGGLLHMHIYFYIFVSFKPLGFPATLIGPCKVRLVTDIFHLQEPLFPTKESPELFRSISLTIFMVPLIVLGTQLDAPLPQPSQTKARVKPIRLSGGRLFLLTS